MNTYFPIIPKTNNDMVEKIILNADVASSILFGERNGLILTKRLKNEADLKEKSIALYSKFLEKIKQR